MPRNGSGTQSSPGSSFPAVVGALIESAKFNTVINDINASLTASIANDGQTPILANLPMYGFKHTGVAAANASGQYVEYAQYQAGIAAATPADASVTQAKLSTNVAGNGPAFRAVNSVSQSITATTYTKVAFQTEQNDTNNNFDNVTNYRFQPTVAGYYQISGSIMNGGSTANSYMQLIIYKNGSAYKTSITHTSNASVATAEVNDSSIQMNGSSDYLELWVYFGFTGGIQLADFSGHLARAA